MLAQTTLVSIRQVHLHRRLGWTGAALAVVMVVLGVWGSLIAAARPTGFVNVPVPPLQFLIVPLGILALFAAFVTLAFLARRRSQSHKRYMILASVALIEAGIARWPFAIMQSPSPVPGLGMMEFAVDLFLVPLLLWDVVSRGRPHPVTLWGAVAIVGYQMIRMPLAATGAWQALAAWAVGFVA